MDHNVRFWNVERTHTCCCCCVPIKEGEILPRPSGTDEGGSVYKSGPVRRAVVAASVSLVGAAVVDVYLLVYWNL